ncbi:MAG: glycosyltransferase [Magnetococcus sp. WYHC-3]
MTIRLTISMPTYNFAHCISETLDSLVPQLTHEVELLILDGASSDNTPEIVNRYAARYPQIRYIRKGSRGGIDRDLAESVDLAKGEYAWIVSSDDIVRPGAVEKVLQAVTSGLDAYVCEFRICDGTMRPIVDMPKLAPGHFGRKDWHDAEQRAELFANANCLSVFFSFCSAVIVSRARWLSAGFDERFLGSCYAHVARMFSMIPEGFSVGYLPDVLLDKRGDNDSFQEHGQVNRIGIDVEGFNRLGNTFFGRESREAYHIRRILRGMIGINRLFSIKMNCVLSNNMADRRRLDGLVFDLYNDPGWKNRLKHFLYKFTPFRVYRGVNVIYKPLKRFLGISY